MKTDTQRKQLIQDILIMLYQAYDSTLDEIYALLKKIEEEDDDEDLQAYDKAKKDIQINGTISWEQAKKEMKQDVA